MILEFFSFVVGMTCLFAVVFFTTIAAFALIDAFKGGADHRHDNRSRGVVVAGGYGGGNSSLMASTPSTRTLFQRFVYLMGDTVVGETTTITRVDTSVPAVNDVLKTLCAHVGMNGILGMNGIAGITVASQQTIKAD